MKNILLSIFAIFILGISMAIVHAGPDDDDEDGVPNVDEDGNVIDQCPNSGGTTIVDQFGCSCSQKNCPSDNNECTDDCLVIDGLPSCAFANNENQCQEGYCAEGVCVRQSRTEVADSNGMSPSGIVQSIGDPTYVTLRWPAFEGATHYNVRLDDGTSERIDDPRFETCPDSPHYYCENGITETFIDGVPVKPGKKYNFWVDPIIPGREYFNVNTQFSVTNLNQEVEKSATSSNIVPSDIVTSGDFVITSLASVSPSENQGPQSTIVIVASIGDHQPPIDVDSARKIVFGNEFGTVNDYYIKNSYEKMSLTGKVIGKYSLPVDTCTSEEILRESVKTADENVNFNDYSRIIIFVPNTGCERGDLGNMGGFASIGKKRINTNDGEIRASVSWNRVAGMEVPSHELGHNFGLGHADLLPCHTCQSIAASDPYTIMGSMGEDNNWNKIARHLSAIHKEEAGWLTNTIITTQGEFLLKPLEKNQPSGSIQQIKLPLIREGYYSLDFRQPFDYDNNLPDKAYSGVFIHTYYDTADGGLKTNLINYEQSDKSPLLQVGQKFIDRMNGYEVELKNTDSSGAFLSVSTISRDRSPYISLIYPSGGETFRIGEVVTIKWRSIDIPSDEMISLILQNGNNPEFLNIGTFPNTGSYSWTIDNKVNELIKEGSSKNVFHIEIAATQSNVNYHMVNPFTITDSENNDITGQVIESIDGKETEEIEGELEVIHFDDFKNPEKSKYIHYIIIDGKKYEIKSEDKLPVVLSGSKAKVKGLIVDDKFYLENYINAHPEIGMLKEIKSLPKTEIKSKKQLGFFSSDWIYILAPTMIIIAYLAYLEAHRIKEKGK